MGRIEAIWIKPGRRESMKPVESATLVAQRGIDGNADQAGKRQVTIVDRSAWERATVDLGVEVEPSARRANVLVSGIALEESSGQVMRLGPCRVEIHGETKPCGRMDEAHPGLREALLPEWRAGAYGVVLTGGRLSVGDRVAWEERGA
jgi:MOSC domain-containing protein YiiM